jgi:hypothetical protein
VRVRGLSLFRSYIFLSLRAQKTREGHQITGKGIGIIHGVEKGNTLRIQHCRVICKCARRAIEGRLPDWPGLIADLIQIFYDAESARIKEDRLQRSLRWLAAKKSLRTSYPSYILKMQDGQMQRLRKWAAARDHLGLFIAEGSVEGLVHTPDGIDLSSNGNDVILRKAQSVHTYCSVRLLGVPRAQAVEMVGASVPKSVRMSSQATLYRYIKEYLELKGFRETGNGKYVRDNVFRNTALMYAMKEWLKMNEYTVIASADDPEDQKYFIAQHAADYLNKLLEAHPRFQVHTHRAAALPIKVGVMRTWLKTYLGREWKVKLIT